MAVTGNAYSAANLAATIPEIWSPVINEKNFPHAVLTNFCLDLSEYISEGGDVIHVPDLYTNALTVSTQSTEGTEITPSVAAQVDDSITVTTHVYVAWMFGDNTMSQVASKYGLNEAYARQAQGLLMNTIEGALAALWSSLSTSAVGDTSTGVSDAEIRRAISALESADFRVEEMAFFFHPEVYWEQIHGISKYYTFDTSGFELIKTGNLSGQTGMQHAYKGQLFGIPVYTTTNIVNSLQTFRNLLLTPRAFAFGIRPLGGSIDTEFGPTPLKIRVQAEYQLRNLAMLTVADMSYGVGAIRADGGVVINSSNAYVNS